MSGLDFKIGIHEPAAMLNDNDSNLVGYGRLISSPVAPKRNCKMSFFSTFVIFDCLAF
ncbi:hypothetical protein CPB83DRAFT_859436 [Crepidotus variabilis]|uniref:Uncharacterized protein n=1 Tax=Crepidotus variabilis TaxID=179855 RepID=A0A9P6JIY2_9AGAR|nr:hypothetical protein CPB83DRAFT_864280 [Crepidotus variabilis]KAF9525536.1 hypothetical protein CPB83DRAFT_859436 [Crepidotus variabilis]